jgi:dienelactone hydrolase
VVDVTEPHLDIVDPPSPAGVTAVALVLHGGRERSHAEVKASSLAAWRMRPFARDFAAKGGARGLAVWSLRYRVRGWNGSERSPVADASWALDEIARRHGDVPVVLVGHSMGGRTAVHVADHPLVTAACLLAPWLPADSPYETVTGRAVLVVHGRLDTTTSPRASLQWSRQAATVTDRIWRVEVRRERHAMLWRSAVWHRLSTDFMLGALGQAPMPPLLSAVAPDERLQITL